MTTRTFELAGMLITALETALTRFGRLAGTGIVCDPSRIPALNTSRNRPVSAQRSHCWDVTTEEVMSARGLVSLPRICSNKMALACCSSEACNIRETGFGLLEEPTVAIGITPCRPTSGPSVSAGWLETLGAVSVMTASTGRIACTHEGRSTGESDSSPSDEEVP